MRWQYVVRLAGCSYQEGLLDADKLLEWLLPRIKDSDDVIRASLLPLLQACCTDAVLSQQQFQQVADCCGAVLATHNKPGMPVARARLFRVCPERCCCLLPGMKR